MRLGVRDLIIEHIYSRPILLSSLRDRDCHSASPQAGSKMKRRGGAVVRTVVKESKQRLAGHAQASVQGGSTRDGEGRTVLDKALIN